MSDEVEPAEIGYAQAIVELEQILDDLEDDDVDIDVLATKVERAAALVEVCRGKISAAKIQVERIVGELELVAETE